MVRRCTNLPVLYRCNYIGLASGDVMLVWSYPILDADTEAVVKEVMHPMNAVLTA